MNRLLIFLLVLSYILSAALISLMLYHILKGESGVSYLNKNKGFDFLFFDTVFILIMSLIVGVSDFLIGLVRHIHEVKSR